MLYDEDSEFDETDDDDDATFAEDIVGDHVVDEQETVDRLSLFDPVNPDVDNKVDLYLLDTSTKLSSLKKYPTLKQLFLKYKAALPSSASVEPLFSLAGRIFVTLRNTLSNKFRKTSESK